MTQAQALAILKSGLSVFLTGPAGSGKTYVLNQFIRYARDDGKRVAVTASTGLAATHLNGNTIHAWSGMGVHDSIPRKLISDMSKSRREQIEHADILVIDEVSMLHDYRLDMVEEITRKVRKNDQPFGGLQVVLCGDFFQLPPVNRGDSREGGFIVNSAAWEALNPVICYLEEQHRQEDDQLLALLQAMRAQDLRRRHLDALLERKAFRTPFDEPVTELYTKNIDVDTINNARLNDMDGETEYFDMYHTGKAHYVEALMRSCLAPQTLALKRGSFVMFVKNSLEKKYVNGTLGTVVDFDQSTGYPIVQTKDGREVIAKPDTWELRDGNKKLASLTQVPLRLAWAITVHKSQGMTLDAAHIDLSTAFVEGMGYVALSRVRSLKTLSLAGLNGMALKVSDEAVRIDHMLREQSELDAVKYVHLEAEMATADAKKPKKKSKKTGSGAWAEKLAKMRETYPNAYRPWAEDDDKKLLTLYEEGSNTDTLTGVFGRHPGSIRARLKMHLGEDTEIR